MPPCCTRPLTVGLTCGNRPACARAPAHADATSTDSWCSDQMDSGRKGEAPRSSADAGRTDPHRWWGLVVIALAQLMVVLDAMIVNIALPSAQHDLHMSDANRQWV